jgi:hypothetical protein
MKVESLRELEAAFDGWRSKKRHAREAVPADLLERARGMIGVHGLGAVALATRVDRTGLRIGRRGQRESAAPATGVPSFSRVELAGPVGPAAAGRPFAEVETPTGLKLRIFTQTREALELVTSLLGMGGAQ